MTWLYSQATGKIRHDESIVACGYSGNGICKNVPTSQDRHNLGPIPRGKYRMEKPRDTDTHGPFVIPLSAHLDNQMFGRSGFLIHGDSTAHPGAASLGCIIADRGTREQIWSSDDHDLEVTE